MFLHCLWVESAHLFRITTHDTLEASDELHKLADLYVETKWLASPPDPP